MKILWISPFFLHPTDRGAQIRTLGTLRQLHKRHEVHFAGLNDPANVEGPQRAAEYSTRHIVVEHAPPKRASIGILPQLLGSLVSSVPLAVSRYASSELKGRLAALIKAEKYDSIVCDFLASAPNLPDLGQCVLFQHNVETTIWQRHVEQAHSPLDRGYFGMQAKKMEAYERKVCQRVKAVIAVSDVDARRMKGMFGIDRVNSVPTGVDLDYFRPTQTASPTSDIVFCGSMDWLPNIDAVEYFLQEILPVIRQSRPETTFTIAGRSPDARVKKAVQGIVGVTVTGKVPDMRPYLWGSKLSIVPIRIGGGTRLKIYECMAAGLPVVSTTVGAEGLAYTDGKDIAIADSPVDFAQACLRLLADDSARAALASEGLKLVESRFSWEAVSRDFEAILEQNRA
jgi:polysaccharide biosynthesis protein PslH